MDDKSLLASVTVSEFIMEQKKNETSKKISKRIRETNEREFELVNDRLGILSLKERRKGSNQ